MTENLAQPTPKKKRSLVLPITAVVIAIALTGFFASRAGLDKALMKQVVDGFIANVEERGRARGHDITITYGDLEVVGSFTNKHVVMHQPVLVIKPLNQPTPQAEEGTTLADAVKNTLRVSTGSLEIYPEATDLSSLRIQLPEPIDFAGAEAPDKSLLKITSDVPPSVTVGQLREGDIDFNDITYASPSHMTLTYLRETQATGEEEKTPELVPVYENLTLAMAKGGIITLHAAQDHSGLGTASINLSDIVITPEKQPTQALMLPKIKGEWSNVRNQKKANSMHAALDVGPITSADATLPYQPVTLTLDATYEGAVPNTTEAVAGGASAQDSSIVLKTFTLSTKDASLNATANFTANASDVVPVGTANVSLSNAPYVLSELTKYGVLNERSEPLVASLLQRITGKPMAELKDVAIPIERVRGGAFKIGNSTFEELVAILLGGVLQRPAVSAAPTEGVNEKPLVPQLPAGDKPKSAPIEIPDHGVRG